MEKSALAQEKVWFDKPSYDKAERLYFERMAKVVSRKIMENCSLKSEISVTDNCRDVINSNSVPKRKSEKSKDNKSLIIENASNDALKPSKRHAKSQKTNKDEDDNDAQRKEHVEEKKRHNSAKSGAKGKETSPLNETRKKCNSKEIKEEKNKADTINRNREKGKNNTDAVKENVPTLIRNKEQLPNQGNQQPATPILSAGGSLANEVAKARQHIIQSLQCVDDIAAVAGVCTQGADAKKDCLDIHNGLREAIQKLEERVKALEERVFASCPAVATCPAVAICPAKPAPAPKQPSEKDDEDIDLFGSDSEGEDAEAAKIREERLAAYAAKKAKKPALIAKSNIILDVKPWDDTTDMELMEAEVRKIEMNGLLWGAAKLVPLAFGIHKLQISCVVEDDKVSVDELTERIQDIEDYVQSVDIAAFNKI